MEDKDEYMLLVCFGRKEDLDAYERSLTQEKTLGDRLTEALLRKADLELSRPLVVTNTVPTLNTSLVKQPLFDKPIGELKFIPYDQVDKKIFNSGVVGWYENGQIGWYSQNEAGIVNDSKLVNVDLQEAEEKVCGHFEGIDELEGEDVSILPEDNVSQEGGTMLIYEDVMRVISVLQKNDSGEYFSIKEITGKDTILAKTVIKHVPEKGTAIPPHKMFGNYGSGMKEVQYNVVHTFALPGETVRDVLNRLNGINVSFPGKGFDTVFIDELKSLPEMYPGEDHNEYLSRLAEAEDAPKTASDTTLANFAKAFGG